MSQVVRISDEAFEYVCNNQKKDGNWKETHYRLLGLDNSSEFITRQQAEDLIEEKINDLKRGY